MAPYAFLHYTTLYCLTLCHILFHVRIYCVESWLLHYTTFVYVILHYHVLFCAIFRANVSQETYFYQCQQCHIYISHAIFLDNVRQGAQF